MKLIKNIAVLFGLIMLTVVVISLPFWNPFQMDFGNKVAWWVAFGGGLVYIWVHVLRNHILKP